MAVSAEMKDHLAGSPTLAVFVTITSRFGDVIRVTNATRNKIVNGDTFLSVPFQPTQLQEMYGLKPDNAELVTILGGLFTAATLRNKRWMGARVEYCLYNYKDFTQGTAIKKIGFLGDVQVGKYTAKPELLSISNKLSQNVGLMMLESCNVVRLGDTRCGVDLNGNTVDGYKIRLPAIVTAVANRQQFTVNFTDYLKPANHAITTAPDDLYFNGEAEFTSGSNDGLETLVLGNTGNSLSLWLPAFYDIQVNDTLNLTVGCDRSIAQCVARFGNGERNRSFWALRGREHLFKF